MSLTFNMVSGNYGDIPTPTEKTVSGAIVLSTAINPVQDLHGYDSPWPAGGGKNLFVGKALTQTINTMAFELTADDVLTVNGTNTASGTIYFNVYENSDGKRHPTFPAGTYTFSSKTALPSGMQLTFGIRDTSGNSITGVSNAVITASAQSVTRTVGQEFTFFMNVNCTGGMTADYSGGIQIESGSPATAWTPYSNICPISGFGAANIVVSPTTTAGDGTTYTVSFGAAGTVYGGTLDVTAGTLTVTHGQIASYAGETLPGAWISDRNAYAVGTTPTTGAQVVYELASVQTYTLTPTEVTLLLGTNNVWSDTGDTTLTYLADGRVNALTALNMLLGGTYTPSADVSDREALDIIMGDSE